ncbi:copper-translocating P-type ATPase [Liquorilactobacillus satsumensis]|nr:heavy metal translocating P-type ATPase [Liquorilactobacillus satsumensis]MCC7666819.1 copper-translocating P-type ATPase [Liquorilactobacillus satsumensis]MCP9358367.1 copper-translocating P-type ATPase [Liquorilactobacillus satsumensis]MCP9372328.1 copper-translocating P-type ATPase [Liquorilactobacillus satsumensis]
MCEAHAAKKASEKECCHGSLQTEHDCKLHMNHGQKDHGHMDHGQMNHEQMDHGHMDHEHMDHGQMNHEHMNHGQMDHGQMDHGHMNHGQMDHGHMNHGQMDHAHMNHDQMMHGGHMMHMGNLKQKFWVSLILTIPVIIMSPMMGVKLPFQITFAGSDWIVALLGTILFFYGGKPFFNGAKGELAEKKPAMMTLITLGISVAYIYSVYAVIANNILGAMPHVMDFFWELATLIVIMLLGHWIEMNAVMNAGSAVDQLAKLLPNSAHLVKQTGAVVDVPVTELKKEQELQVRAGEQVPADGIIISGQSSLNESLVTGEASAVAKKQGDQVIGGTLNGNGTFNLRVTGTGETGYLAKVVKLVQAAQQNKSQTETMADKVAGYLFYAALSIGIISFIAWLSLDSLAFALSTAVTVFIIACPHALGLAIPLVAARSTSIAAANGLLIRNRSALEQVKRVRYVLMDKTGTLTEGIFKVNAIKTLVADYDEKQILQLFASLESQSTHPLATGILKAAKDKKLTFEKSTAIQQQTGVGLSGKIAGTDYAIVSLGYVEKQQLKFPRAVTEKLAAAGNTISFLLQGEHLIGMVAQGDRIKPQAKKMVQQLLDQGLTPVMLTGDNQATAEKVANQLGIRAFKAQLLPEDKEKQVQLYQEKGKVLFVGDGVNDAPSLARADIGVAIGSGTDVAVDSADVVLVESNPNDIVKLLQIARLTIRKMTQNLWWASGYNIVALPLAAGILAHWGIVLDPMVGAIVMSLSTIIVALNAMTLNEEKIR